jgi:hypothetical protein
METIKKSKTFQEQGYIWVPYIIECSTTIIWEGNMGSIDDRYGLRDLAKRMEIRKRREKIESILKKIEGDETKKP